jgi:hypothetical protein
MGVSVGVAVRVGVSVATGVGVSVGMGVNVGIKVLVGVGVGVGAWPRRLPKEQPRTANKINKARGTLLFMIFLSFPRLVELYHILP